MFLIKIYVKNMLKHMFFMLLITCFLHVKTNMLFTLYKISNYILNIYVNHMLKKNMLRLTCKPHV